MGINLNIVLEGFSEVTTFDVLYYNNKLLHFVEIIISKMCAKKYKGDDLSKKGSDSKRDGSGYEKWEKGKTKLKKDNTPPTKSPKKK
jgi:hypothetical protein